MQSLHNAKQKVRSLLHTIGQVKELDFPYQASKTAAEHLEEFFSSHLQQLDDIRDTDDQRSVRTLCLRTIEHIDNYLMALGFIVRACDVSGPVELQGPLLRLTKQALGNHANLIISSEWRFSPFTLLYPDQFGYQFVLVGLPVSEAGNPFIAPLAGHELGHNIWRTYPSIRDHVGDAIRKSILDLIRGEYWEDFSKLFEIGDRAHLDQQELFSGMSWEIAHAWGISQCEEMFCDFIGIAIFGESYLHAFEYLLAPGGGLRNPVYPGIVDRARALKEAAAVCGFKPREGFEDEFLEEDTIDEPKQQLLLSISDRSAKSVIRGLAGFARDFCEKKSLFIHDPTEVERIASHFRQITPAIRAKSLADIINAAWLLLLEEKSHWLGDYPAATADPQLRIELLKELALKSFEVFEIERILEEPE